MKQKKILDPVPHFSLPNNCNSNNSILNECIIKFNGTTNFSLQQDCIKIFSGFLKDYEEIEDHHCALKILAFIYVTCTAKHPIKKSLTRILLPYQDNYLLSKYLSESIKSYEKLVKETDEEKLMAVKDSFFNALYTSFEVKAFTASVLENFDLLFDCGVGFLSELVDVLWDRKLHELSSVQDFPLYIYNTTKFLLCLLQKHEVKTLDDNCKLTLIKSLYEIIIHNTISFEVKCNCGHMMILIFKNLSSDLVKESIVPDHAYLDFLLFGQKETGMLKKIGIEEIHDESVFEMFQICVFIGITIVAPGDLLYRHKIDDKIILAFMLQKLIYTATKKKQNIHQIMGISKGLTLLSSHLQYLGPEQIECLLQQYLQYLNIYIDNVPDVVKNNSITILKNLIKALDKFTKKGYDFIKIIMDWFRSLYGSSHFYIVMVTLCSEIGCNTILKENPDLAEKMLINLSNPTKAANVLSCFEKLMQIHRRNVQSKHEWINYWAKEILTYLKKSTNPQVFIDLFVAAFKIEPDSLSVLTEKETLETDSELLALLGCIHFARKTGLSLDFSKYLGNSGECWRKLLDFKSLDVLKTHLNDEIRILVLGIIVDSHSSTETFTEWELNYLIQYLYYNIYVPNANFRQKLVSYVKKTMQRLSDVTASLQNKIEAVKKCEQDEVKKKLLANAELISAPILNYFSKFWNSLFNNVLLSGLYSDSNYLRKSTCLEVLLLSKAFLSKLEFQKLWKDEDIENLKYIVDCDTYEQNKEVATTLLMEFQPVRLNFHKKQNISLYVDKCLSLALDIKPVQTISAAYMLNLCLMAPNVHNIILEKLKNTHFQYIDDKNDASYLMLCLLSTELRGCLRIAQQNLQEAAASKPIHGLIFCIRHILNNTKLTEKKKMSHWRDFCRSLINLCLELTAIVNTIVCNDSPEGYLPEDLESNVSEVDGTAKAQMITVYGWRATKEISLLFGELSLNAPFCYDAKCEGVIDEEQVMIIGTYFFDLLINTKHRGAFEQASIGFCNLCARLWRLMDTPVNTLPLSWLNTVTLLLLGTHTEGIKSCETRRSAGIPFMVQAILSTEPISAGCTKNFDSFMKTLLDVAHNEIYPAEQRILALNILRALYRHNRLGEIVIPYCAQGIIIAVKGFGCSVWGIRNSATLLFSSLIMRIFGVQRLRDTIEISIKNKMQGQVFFVRYPELFDFLLQELRIGSVEKYHPSLYPVLLILSRLYCNKEAVDRSQLDVFLPYVKLCLNNPSFKIRELAAQTIPALSEPSKLPQVTVKCIFRLSNNSLENNYCHGLLLQLQRLLRLQCSASDVLNIEKFLNDTLWILQLCGYRIHPITATLYLEILFYLIVTYDPKFNNINVFHKIMEVFIDQEQNWTFESSSLKKFNENVFNIKLAYILHVKTYQAETCAEEISIYRNIISDDLKNRSGVLQLCLCYINYIEFSSPYFKEFNLFEEDFEHYQTCNLFLKPLAYEMRLFLYDILFSCVVETVTTDIKNYNYAIDTLILHNLSKDSMCSIQQFLLENNKKYVKNHGENYGCLVIAHLHKLFHGINDFELSNLDFKRYLDLLLKFGSSDSNSSHRLAVAKLLENNKRLFYVTPPILSNDHVRSLWEMVFVLLEDDDEDVRKTVCSLCRDDFKTEDCLTFVSQVRVDIPELSRIKLLKQMTLVLPRDYSIQILLSQIFRTNAVTKDNLSEVFEEGSLNAYVEFWPVAKAATEELFSMFVSTSRNYVAEELYKNLWNQSISSISSSTKYILCSIFKDIIEEKYDVEKSISLLLSSSTKLDASEAVRLKMFFNKMFFTNLE